MFSRIFFLCLFVALNGRCSSLICKWMHHNFRRCSNTSMRLLDSMAPHYIDTSDMTRDNETVPFPVQLYINARSASAEDKLDLTVQVLEEVDVLFKENKKSVPWDKVTVDHFRMAINRQAEGFSKCIHNYRKLNEELCTYFNTLSDNILKENGHSAEAWELIRKQIKRHLTLTDDLISNLLRAKN